MQRLFSKITHEQAGKYNHSSHFMKPLTHCIIYRIIPKINEKKAGILISLLHPRSVIGAISFSS